MTDKEAIIATIKHWQKDYLKLDLFGGRRGFTSVFSDTTCPLCQHHGDTMACANCPLVPTGRNCGCSPGGEPFNRAQWAYIKSDKPAFMAARSALLKRLQRALVKAQKQERIRSKRQRGG